MISVIVPVYQAELFVAKAVQSAYEQKEVSEIILVEDCSTDNSLKICESLVDSHQPLVKLFQHPDRKNHGAGASRNLGIKQAKSKYVAFLDADDYYLPGRFEHDIIILDNNPCVDGIYNALGVHIYNEAERQRIDSDLTTVKYPIPPENLFEEMAPIGSSGYFSGVALTVRKAIFDQVGFFDTTLELSQDTHMWIKMAAKATLVSGVIDEPVAMRGVHTDNRVKDKDKLDYYRPLLFGSLLEWANANSVLVQRKRILWDQLYQFYGIFLNNQKNSMVTKKLRMFFFLVKHGFSNPYLIVHKNFLSSFAKLLKL